MKLRILSEDAFNPDMGHPITDREMAMIALDLKNKVPGLTVYGQPDGGIRFFEKRVKGRSGRSIELRRHSGEAIPDRSEAYDKFIINVDGGRGGSYDTPEEASAHIEQHFAPRQQLWHPSDQNNPGNRVPPSPNQM